MLRTGRITPQKDTAMNLEQHENNGVVYFTAPVLDCPHAFSARLGGVSTGVAAGLNLSARKVDQAENVRENWRRLAEATGMELSRAVYATQIHSRIVRVAKHADAQPPWEKARFQCDGFVTNEPGLPLAVFMADCIPVLLQDRAHGVIGAVHCGWRGSTADILGAAIEKMRSLGASVETISAAVGPGIGPCCFEVGPEVVAAADRLLGGDTDGLVRPGEGDRSFLDLKRVNARRLTQLGVDKERIAVSESCTKCAPELFWSHRTYSTKRGVMAAVIML